LAGRVHELLNEIQRTLFERAVQFRAEHTQEAQTYEQFKQMLEGRPGYVLAPWCGSAACEAQIKTDTQATIRNIPMDATRVDGLCVRGDAPAEFVVRFAKSY
jgi:prolyl-tRNA synthetase